MNVLARIVCQQRASPFLRFTIQLFHGRVLGLRTLPVISVPVSSLELFFFFFFNDRQIAVMSFIDRAVVRRVE